MLVVLNDLSYDTLLSFMLNKDVADVNCLVVFKSASIFIFICFNPQSTIFYILAV